ncbi:MAG: cysteine synthase family protein [Thermodesulfobacteriota bacterium]|nr:cysteine synthase family protein [Thermodesulfobacteriota bacterium]
MIHESVLDTIGKTPLVKINKLNPNKRVSLSAKIESFNPSGSLKDRVAHFIISKAEEEGALTKDKVILESTSGNMGISLAMVAAVKGYRVAVTLLESASMEKRSLLEAYGVEIFSIPAEKGPDGARDEAMKLQREHPEKYFLAGQNFNENNIMAHYETTGMEIWEDTNGEVDCFVAGIGTSGTVMGVGKRLRELNPEVRIIGVEPYPRHKVYGLKNLEESRLPEIYDRVWVDETIRVSDKDAIQTARQLVRKEGIFAGISSGAVMHAALEKVMVLDKGNVVVLLADSGERYLSTGLLTGEI